MVDTLLRGIRKKVSGDKKRYSTDQFDLDLTYITDRIIAMAYPATGLEAIYRNDANQVAKMLKAKYSGRFRIYNLTKRTYDIRKFDNDVKEIGWFDHHAPPLELLFSIVENINRFLLFNPENVVAIHCLAGKGRTGTVIICYLLYSGLFHNVFEACNYFAIKRSVSNWGVTGPSQQRYINYFWTILQRKKPPNLSQKIQLISMRIPYVTKISDKKDFYPIITIYYMGNDPTDTLIYDSKRNLCFLQEDSAIVLDFLNEDLILEGDINITIGIPNSFGRNSNFARFAFHVGMLLMECSQLKKGFSGSYNKLNEPKKQNLQFLNQNSKIFSCKSEINSERCLHSVSNQSHPDYSSSRKYLSNSNTGRILQKDGNQGYVQISSEESICGENITLSGDSFGVDQNSISSSSSSSSSFKEVNCFIYMLGKRELDDAHKDRRIQSDFSVEILFKIIDDPPSVQNKVFWDDLFSNYTDKGGVTCFFPPENQIFEKIALIRSLVDIKNGTRPPQKGGYLMKRGHIVKNWKLRWFALHTDTLEYYKSPKESSPIAVIHLDDLICVEKIKLQHGVPESFPNIFEIIMVEKELLCCVESEAEMNEWIDAINIALRVRKNNRQRNYSRN